MLGFSEEVISYHDIQVFAKWFEQTTHGLSWSRKLFVSWIKFIDIFD